MPIFSTLFSLIYSNAIHKNCFNLAHTHIPSISFHCFSQIGSVLSNYLVLPFLGIYCHKINVTSVINGYHSLLLIEIMLYNTRVITYELVIHFINNFLSNLRYFIGCITFLVYWRAHTYIAFTSDYREKMIFKGTMRTMLIHFRFTRVTDILRITVVLCTKKQFEVKSEFVSAYFDAIIFCVKMSGYLRL